MPEYCRDGIELADPNNNPLNLKYKYYFAISIRDEENAVLVLSSKDVNDYITDNECHEEWCILDRLRHCELLHKIYHITTSPTTFQDFDDIKNYLISVGCIEEPSWADDGIII